MSYDKFIQQLARGNTHKFTAYDSKEGDKGCLIYVRGREHAIFVPDEIIEHRSAEAIQMIRSIADQDLSCTSIIELKDMDGTLIFEAMHADGRGSEAGVSD